MFISLFCNFENDKVLVKTLPDDHDKTTIMTQLEMKRWSTRLWLQMVWNCKFINQLIGITFNTNVTFRNIHKTYTMHHHNMMLTHGVLNITTINLPLYPDTSDLKFTGNDCLLFKKYISVMQFWSVKHLWLFFLLEK